MWRKTTISPRSRYRDSLIRVACSSQVEVAAPAADKAAAPAAADSAAK
ncbi:MAG: hypothetical protein IKO21_09775 [Fibrobacter sp.]|nr:hypothetical protein [Fibrobacter sp.]